jgi:nitroreductase
MILPAIQERRSVREYDAQEVSAALIRELVQAAQFAPTGMNNRAVEYVVVRDPQTKKRLFEMLEPQQPFVREAPVLLVPVTKQSIVEVHDLSIATAFIMLQAKSLGLGTVWKHVADDKKSEVAKALGLPEGYTLVNIIPIGFPKKPLPAHAEKEFEERKIHTEKW